MELKIKSPKGKGESNIDLNYYITLNEKLEKEIKIIFYQFSFSLNKFHDAILKILSSYREDGEEDVINFINCFLDSDRTDFYINLNKNKLKQSILGSYAKLLFYIFYFEENVCRLAKKEILKHECKVFINPIKDSLLKTKAHDCLMYSDYTLRHGLRRRFEKYNQILSRIMKDGIKEPKPSKEEVKEFRKLSGILYFYNILKLDNFKSKLLKLAKYVCIRDASISLLYYVMDLPQQMEKQFDIDLDEEDLDPIYRFSIFDYVGLF